MADISYMMEKYFPRNNKKSSISSIVEQYQMTKNDDGNSGNDNNDVNNKKILVASTDRADALLGFKPRVSLEDGIIRLLAWHYDRSYPFGDSNIGSSTQKGNVNNNGDDDPVTIIKEAGMESCSPFDKECLQGSTIFSCSSDCSHVNNCVPSKIYGGIAHVSSTITDSCVDVMYTVDLDESLVSIASSNQPNLFSSLRGEHCNIAFVNERSPLMLRLKYTNGIPSNLNIGDELVKGKGEPYLLKSGFWTLLPVSVPSPMSESEYHRMRLLIKLSPGYFFSANTKYALYCDSTVTFKNAPNLLQTMKTQPGNVGIAGTTLMMVGTTSKKRGEGDGYSSSSSLLQEKTYNSIKIALGDRMGIPSHHSVDTSWLAHALSSSDAHGLRCDIYGEMIKWEALDDTKSFDFILSLNDFWSTTMAMWNDSLNTWWRRHDIEGLDGGVESDEKLLNETNIKVNTGYWVAIPSVGKFEFVRLVPSSRVLINY